MLPPLQPNTNRQTYIDPQSQVPGNQRPYAFSLSSNVQDLYSAYRLNANMGVYTTSPPKPIENRVGFFNERPNLGDSNNNNRLNTVSLPRLNPNGHIFDTQNQPPLPVPPWQNQFGLPYPQQYGQVQPILAMNGPMVVPTPPLQVLMYSLFPEQFIKKAQKKKRLSTLDLYEKMIVDQNQRLKKIAKSIQHNQFDVFDIETIKRKAHRLKPHRLSDDTPPEGEESERSVLIKQTQNNKEEKSQEKSPIISPALPEPIESPASPEESQKAVSPLDKKLDKMARAKRPLQLHLILWVLVYPSFLCKDADERVDGRKKKVENGSVKKIQDQKNQVREFINRHCMGQLQDIYKQKKALVIVNEGGPKEKPVSEKDRLKNFAVIMEKLTAVVSSLKGVISLQEFPKGTITFFEGITREKGIIPPKFLTEIEISYLEFSQYGTLKNLNEMRCKMILGLFTFIRVLICICMANPWVYLNKIKETPILVKNLKGCSSVLYYILIDYFRENLEVVPNNQQHVPAEKKVVPTKNSLLVFATQHGEDKVDEVLTGIYKRESIQSYFDSQQEKVNKLKELLVECYDKLFFLVPKGRE